MRRWVVRFALSLAVLAGVFIPMESAFAFTDVPGSYWDYTAITYVAQTHTWMQDYGTQTFQPTTLETRELYARSLVNMYAPDEPIDPTIVIHDLPNTDPFYRYANVAIKLGWMPLWNSGNWGPTKAVKGDAVDRGVIAAMGVFTDAIKGLANIHQNDGDPYVVDDFFPYIELAHWMDFHYNHSDESQDVSRSSAFQRDEIAYTLWKAETAPSWQIDEASMFDTITLGKLDETNATQALKQKMTQYALDQLGYPYIWGGEWNAKTGDGYCCGSQPQGGMDCSGFVWWTMKQNEGGYNAAQFHPDYKGWSLPQRTSSDMAHNTSKQITFANLRIGDLMFFASDGGSSWSDVDHVGVYLGKNWMINSTGSGDGPLLDWVGDGYYYDIFVYARRIISDSIGPQAPAPLPANASAGDGPREGGERGDR